MTQPAELRFEASWSVGDGRTITGVAAPFGIPATIGSHDGPPVRVMLAAGAFSRAVKAPDRVELRFEHAADGDITGVVGHGIRLAETDDRLEGSWRAYPTLVGDQALAMIEAGSARGLSVGFYERAAHTDPETGTRIITKAHLVEVSLTREPAWTDAAVLQVASAMQNLRPGRDDSLDQRLRAAGFLS
jgi:Escherichia/Staphylococcus phage prohead protease